MLKICKCKGSMLQLHLGCLKAWLNHKVSQKHFHHKPGVSYTLKSFNCEICKEPYPCTISFKKVKIKYKDEIFNLLDYFVPEFQNYIILQSLNSIKENEYPLSIHIIMFTEDDKSFILVLYFFKKREEDMNQM